MGPKDQLKLIVKQFVDLSSSDTSFITSKHAIKYVNKLEAFCKEEHEDDLGTEDFSFNVICNALQGEFSFSYSDIITLLQKLIKFNPYFRYQAIECIQNRMFDKIRNKLKESVLDEMRTRRLLAYKNRLNKIPDCDYRILLHIDDASAFDYENSDNAKYSH